jgi:uncharacterized protein YndB with AHSA1/START domain
MTFDLEAHLAKMHRTVRDDTRDGRPTKVVVAGRRFATAPADLWDAITRPERLGRWFLPIDGDLRMGGRYQFHGNAGGTIEACDAPHHVAVTWEYGGEVSWLAVRIEPDGDGARLVLEHTAPFEAGSPAAEFWTAYGPGAAGAGWDSAFQGLARHLADPGAPAPGPEEVNAWSASPEGRSFFAAVADAWGDAAIAAGEPDEAARAAAERTRRFYTGETEPSAEG